MTKRKELKPEDSNDKITLDILREITSYSDELGPTPLAKANLLQIKNHLNLLIAHQIELTSGVSEADKFMTLGQIEEKMLSLRRSLNEADLKALMEKMCDMPAEDDIVSEKKKSI
ncbi:MAG: hypothetical protein LBP92_13000 [Deltaproteobacteria bacterium]|jgi:hypothetical protein|nr:hypothetical protein [Deltaproteobacteria bacterium]